MDHSSSFSSFLLGPPGQSFRISRRQFDEFFELKFLVMKKKKKFRIPLTNFMILGILS